jgi:hypothetical protein
MDVAEVKNNLKLIEVGSFSCCGLYACDPIPIIQAIENYYETKN